MQCALNGWSFYFTFSLPNLQSLKGTHGINVTTPVNWQLSMTGRIVSAIAVLLKRRRNRVRYEQQQCSYQRMLMTYMFKIQRFMYIHIMHKITNGIKCCWVSCQLFPLQQHNHTKMICCIMYVETSRFENKPEFSVLFNAYKLLSKFLHLASNVHATRSDAAGGDR